MLVPLTNEPRDYAWGSTTLIAELEGRAPSGRAEAEVWFGDHPGDPAETPDGRSLAEWLRTEGASTGAPARLPYLLKLLGAASPLSIQAHPSKSQAEAGFAREDAAGIPRDAADRTYRDANHKPELIVALSSEFHALVGLRDLDVTRRLVDALGTAARPLAEVLAATIPTAPPLAAGASSGASGRVGPSTPVAAIEWALSAEAADEVRAVIAAAAGAHSEEFGAELDLVRQLDQEFPGDPGILVALLMNRVTLRRGEGVFVPAGVLHAYLRGLGVEIMAASDNVLRGGLTPKHIDVAELLAVLDATPGAQPVVRPRELAPGVDRFDVPVADFALDRVRVTAGADITMPVSGATIVLATAGEVAVAGSASGVSVSLTPGDAAFVTPDEGALRITGEGDLFVASPGADAPAGA